MGSGRRTRRDESPPSLHQPSSKFANIFSPVASKACLRRVVESPWLRDGWIACRRHASVRPSDHRPRPREPSARASFGRRFLCGLIRPPVMRAVSANKTNPPWKNEGGGRTRRCGNASAGERNPGTHTLAERQTRDQTCRLHVRCLAQVSQQRMRLLLRAKQAVVLPSLIGMPCKRLSPASTPSSESTIAVVAAKSLSPPPLNVGALQHHSSPCYPPSLAARGWYLPCTPAQGGGGPQNDHLLLSAKTLLACSTGSPCVSLRRYGEVRLTDHRFTSCSSRRSRGSDWRTHVL